MSHKLFITGTDTGVGKTYVSVGLLTQFRRLGYSTIGLKPLASGGFLANNRLYNQDAIDLSQSSSIQLDYQLTNPFVFEPPMAPHIAASQAGIALSLDTMVTALHDTLNYPCDVQIIEGAGGWAMPLNDHETMIDVAVYYKMPVLLVIGLRLGCINHAILTYQAIKHSRLTMLGWVANCITTPLLETEAIITTLRQWLHIPYLGMIPFGEKPEQHIDSKALLQNMGITR